MPDALPSPDPAASRADSSVSALVCSWMDGGPDAAWVQLAGELNIATVPQLVRTLRESQLQARLVVLDLRKLEFIDSSGVHAIVSASIRARRLGGQLVLLRGPPNVDRMFTLTGGSDDFEIGDVDSVESPVQAFLQPAAGDPLLDTSHLRFAGQSSMFKPRPAGPAPGIGGDGRPVRVSRHQRRRGGTGAGKVADTPYRPKQNQEVDALMHEPTQTRLGR